LRNRDFCKIHISICVLLPLQDGESTLEEEGRAAEASLDSQEHQERDQEAVCRGGQGVSAAKYTASRAECYKWEST